MKLQIPTSNHFSQCCQCYGKCGEGSYLLATYPGESPNYFDCLQKCLNYADPNEPLAECRFFTHDYANQGNCYLFSNCPKLDGSCLSCISGKYELALTDIQPVIYSLSGDAKCDPIECNKFGKQCQGNLVGEKKADTQLQCAVNMIEINSSEMREANDFFSTNSVYL